MPVWGSRRVRTGGPRIASLLLALALAAATPQAPAAAGCRARSGRATVPLVELYTSEGCVTCPPADRWFSRRLAPDDGASELAFHVDYWDELGWRDRFGARAHSKRQGERAWAWSSPTVYTPQVMVGTRIHAPWRDPGAFAALLAGARKAPARAGLALRIDGDPANRRAIVAAAPVARANPGAQLWLARYVDARTTRVPAGENRGATLRHDRVVQGLWGPWPLEAPATARVVALPPVAPPWGLVAFVQDTRGDTLQSLALPADRCRPR
jgi:hypothetical protein